MRGYFPREEYEGRWRRLAAEMRREGYAAALIWSRSAGGYEKFADVFYLTHYYSNQAGQADEDAWLGVGFAAVIFVPDETPELVADLSAFPEEGVATDRIVRADEPNRVKLVCDAMRERGLTEGPVALVDEALSAGLDGSHAVTLQAKMLRLELLKVKADLERDLGQFVLDCSDCGRTVHWVAGLGSTPGHWAHREPAPHHEPAV